MLASSYASVFLCWRKSTTDGIGSRLLKCKAEYHASEDGVLGEKYGASSASALFIGDRGRGSRHETTKILISNQHLSLTGFRQHVRSLEYDEANTSD